MYWTLRVLETGLLLTALAGLVLFAVSIVDIVRIETAPVVAGAAQAMPPWAWPGVFLFFGSLLLLQPVRAILMRYRRDDGSRRDDATGAAAKATAEALAAGIDDAGPVDETTALRAEG
jgi:hypothetical protein